MDGYRILRMSINYFVKVNELGDIQGYYNDDVYDVIPEGCFEITETQWQEAIESDANKFVDGVFSKYTPPLTAEGIREAFKFNRELQVEALTVEYEGMTFDANEEAQNRMLRPIACLQNDTDTWLWVLTDNTVVYLTRPQFIGALTLMGTAQTNVWVQP